MTLPIVLTLVGILIVVNPVQPEKAEAPNDGIRDQGSIAYI